MKTQIPMKFLNMQGFVNSITYLPFVCIGDFYWFKKYTDEFDMDPKFDVSNF